MTGERERQVPYVSTTCLQGVDYRETIRRYDDAGINQVELGYCSDSAVDLANVVKSTSFEAIAHNYFRPVDDEFVLNLSSQDEAIRRRSIDYVREGIDFCAQNGIDRYTFHSGFRIDPDTSFRFNTDTVPDAKLSLDTFVESLQTLLPFAKDHGINIAIENNVVEKRHMIDGSPVVLLAGPEEFQALFDRIEVDVLLDVGHLNVAAHTLGFEREQLLETVEPSLSALHLHTNDGTADSHKPVRRTDWAFDVWTDYDVPATIEAHFDNVFDIKKQLQTFWSA